MSSPLSTNCSHSASISSGCCTQVLRGVMIEPFHGVAPECFAALIHVSARKFDELVAFGAQHKSAAVIAVEYGARRALHDVAGDCDIGLDAIGRRFKQQSVMYRCNQPQAV